MTPSDILDQVRYITKTSTTDGTSATADLMRILNDYYLRQVMIFVNTNEDKFGTKADTNLNTTSNQEAYPLPSDCIRIKRMEITYDGTNWYKIRSMDDGDVEGHALDSTSINDYYSTTQPYADIFGDYIYLRPIPSTAITNGLRLWYIKRPSLLSTISSAITTPSDFHGYLAYGVASEVATRQGNDALAAAMFQKWEDGKMKIEKQFSPLNLDQWIGFKALPVRYN